MADANIDHTVYVPAVDMAPTVAVQYDNVGVVVYSKAFATNGVQIWMVPK